VCVASFIGYAPSHWPDCSKLARVGSEKVFALGGEEAYAGPLGIIGIAAWGRTPIPQTLNSKP
jgi:hypothetical protein